MSDGPEISMRVDFFRKVETPTSVTEESSEEYAGSLLKDGVRPLRVPRVGERLLGLPHPLPERAAIVAIEHRFEGVGGHSDDEPSIIAVIKAPWPGDALKGEMVDKFKSMGWEWFEAHADRLRSRST
jgi:hypothetical protein